MIADLFDSAQTLLFEGFVQPLVFSLGLGNLLEDAYAATGWLLLGLLQVAAMLFIMLVLERRWPVEPVTDRPAVAVDVIYSLVHRLGLFRLVLFFTLEPLWDALLGHARLWGLETWHLDSLWPGVTDVGWVSLLIYLVLFDFVGYWVHRAQHQFHWWWALHAVHHSQRQMTVWSDNRNHLLDDALLATVFALLAVLVGVEPGQFVAITVITRLLQSLQHANLRWHFGRVGERLLVSPRFHRLHHSIGIGHESSGRGTLGGHNFGVLLPWWDQLFGTANFELRYDPTGVRDQLPDEGAVDYGQGFWAQQGLGLKRMLGMGPTLNRLADAAARAVGYCLLPRVIALSFLPLLIAGGLAFGFMFFFWESAIDAVRATLEQWSVVEALLAFLDRMGLPQFRSVLAPLVLMAMLVPAVMAIALLAVGLIMTPVIVKLVAQRRFPGLEARRGGSALVGVIAAVGATLAALLMLVASLPFLFIPPLVLILPPLIWGWLTYKVFSYDVLAEHASAEERAALRRQHRLPLLAIGVVCGYLGAAPALIFSLNAAALFLAPFLILVSVWLYTWVFSFATAWFAHYLLAALAAQRGTVELVSE